MNIFTRSHRQQQSQPRRPQSENSCFSRWPCYKIVLVLHCRVSSEITSGCEEHWMLKEVEFSYFKFATWFPRTRGRIDERLPQRNQFQSPLSGTVWQEKSAYYYLSSPSIGRTCYIHCARFPVSQHKHLHNSHVLMRLLLCKYSEFLYGTVKESKQDCHWHNEHCISISSSSLPALTRKFAEPSTSRLSPIYTVVSSFDLHLPQGRIWRAKFPSYPFDMDLRTVKQWEKTELHATAERSDYRLM